ncbi:hypothetical protein UA08_06982 [Talaromyces atroroseus]|uniref:Uncharacterized protein n=1 Tax=Talaromyces atroroseus TaxID=1441469 RepID=A0A225A9R5_TALAT|nr:hypothetical protein UA08_06982 [Talaromyces atroroseus]OKL57641.1 hypothetical protein UA08_06982 [Talaromyces atroroseus]
MEELEAHGSGRDEAEASQFLLTEIDMSTRGREQHEEEEQEGGKERSSSSPEPSKVATYLQRETVSFLMIAIYAIAAIFSWTVLSILSKHAINGQPYSVDIFAKKYTDPAAYHRSEHYYRAAQVINSGVLLLTIPVATAICARAAVMYTQHRRSGLTVRQVGVLADQGWTSIGLLVALLRPRNWKRYTTLLLWLAILLHVLGFLIGPAQQLFLSASTIKTPMDILTREISDISALSTRDLSVSDYLGQLSAQLRSVLGSTTIMDMPATLWFNNYKPCTSYYWNLTSCNTYENGAPSWADVNDMSMLPFIAQLPSNYNTGLIRQFAPRLNSTLTYTQVDESEFPENCDQITGAFYASYNATVQKDYDFYTTEVCMPADLRKTPWNSTRLRQDISETLYLNISQTSSSTYSSSGVYRVQANTTAGYFELPNYLNNNTAGPLLDNGPEEACDRHCVTQGYYDGAISNSKFASLYRREDTTAHTNESSDFNEVENLLNKPPLMAVALALFGGGSFISDRTRTANLGVYSNRTDKNEELLEAFCQSPLPLAGLFEDEADGLSDLTFVPCIGNVEIETLIPEWLSMFTGTVTSISYSASGIVDNTTVSFSEIQRAMLVAVFLANDLWLSQVLPRGAEELILVNQDMGSDLRVPVLSNAGIIAISTLLAVFILSLFAMWAYATYMPVWTSTLNSFAMMRIGAEMGTDVPFLLGYHEDDIEVLDSTPGWVGDIYPEAETGQLGLGAAAQLTKGRKYASYPGQ